MRIVFAGAGTVTLMAAQSFVKWGHDVIVIESDKNKIDDISEHLDCSFLHGDASKPAILAEVNPKQADFLFCLTGTDQINIITALLGRSMGFSRVVPSIEDVELESLCGELGLNDTITPSRTMSRHLQNMVRGLENIQISTLLKNDARFFSFTAGKQDAKPVDELDLPDDSKAVYYYRKDDFYFVEQDTTFRQGDEIVILTRSEHLPELNERWQPKQVGQTQKEA